MQVDLFTAHIRYTCMYFHLDLIFFSFYTSNNDDDISQRCLSGSRKTLKQINGCTSELPGKLLEKFPITPKHLTDK